MVCEMTREALEDAQRRKAAETGEPVGPYPTMLADQLREAIREVDDKQLVPVVMPEWNGITVYVCTMEGDDRGKWELGLLDSQGNRRTNVANFRSSLIQHTACDHTGALIFTKEDMKWLGKKSAAALDRLFTVAARLNGIGKQEEKELAKNSEEEAGPASS